MTFEKSRPKLMKYWDWLVFVQVPSCKIEVWGN